MCQKSEWFLIQSLKIVSGHPHIYMIAISKETSSRLSLALCISQNYKPDLNIWESVVSELFLPLLNFFFQFHHFSLCFVVAVSFSRALEKPIIISLSYSDSILPV